MAGRRGRIHQSLQPRNKMAVKNATQFHFLINYSILNYYPLTRSICYHNNDFFLTNQLLVLNRHHETGSVFTGCCREFSFHRVSSCGNKPFSLLSPEIFLHRFFTLSTLSLSLFQNLEKHSWSIILKCFHYKKNSKGNKVGALQGETKREEGGVFKSKK